MLAASQQLLAQEAGDSVGNGNFEQLDASASNRVPGWTLSPRGVQGGYRLAIVAQDGGHALRITAPDAIAADGRAALFQTPLRGVADGCGSRQGC